MHESAAGPKVGIEDAEQKKNLYGDYLCAVKEIYTFVFLLWFAAFKSFFFLSEQLL